MFEAICDAILKEMDLLEDKYSKGTQLSMQDLEHIDTMAHAMKSLAAYEAMKTGYSRKRYRDEYEREGSYRRY